MRLSSSSTSSSNNLLAFICGLLLLLLLISFHSCEVSAEIISNISAFFIFGDSYVDTGNNNYIETSQENRANHVPYSKDAFFGIPSGRFSNGQIIVDYIAEYAKLPLIPSYLEPSADFSHGVDFASGGAGILSSTNQGLAIDLKTQLKYFEEVEKSYRENLGDSKAKDFISNAVYFISMGTNDYLGGYVQNLKMQELYQPEEYVAMVIGNLTQAIQGLYEKGARKFGFFSLSPLGCLPVLRAQNPNPKEGGCIEEASSLALAHNKALNTVLKDFGNQLSGFKYCNSDFYTWIQKREDNPPKYGFKDGVNACCGMGQYRGIFTCGSTTEEYSLCEDANDYIWWDSVHPTERIHEQFAKVLWKGETFPVGPYTLKDLFMNEENLNNIVDIVDNSPEYEQTF